MGRPVSRRWFIAKAKDIFQRLYPQLVIELPSGQHSYGGFKFSTSWFQGFQRRQHISLRKRTNQAQRQPAHYRTVIQSFHQFIRKVAEPKDYEQSHDIGRFKLENIANMDQTPMPFEVGTTTTYNDTGARTVWIKSLGSGLDKRQATVQLTVHANGIAQTPPMIVFRGKGLRITSKERNQWDKRVVVKFQEKAWVDESISLRWAQSIWKQKTFEPRLLILDVHTAQKTPAFLHALSLRNTIPAFVPAGCTSLVQPLDVSLNKPFKNLVDAQYNQHFEANLDAWALGKISASERRILMTHWIGAAWEIFCHEYKDAIRASFVKCGIALPIDGSQDALINIRGLTDYIVPPWQSNPILNLEHSATDTAPPAQALPSPESDSDSYTDATTSFSESEDDMDIDTSVDQGEDQDTTIGDDILGEVAQLEVPVGQLDVLDGQIEVPVRQVDVQSTRVGQVVHPIQLRRGFRSQITLGEEIM